MVTGEGQARHDGCGGLGGRDPARRQRVAHDAIVGLREERAAVERDTRAAGTAALDAGASADTTAHE